MSQHTQDTKPQQESNMTNKLPKFNITTHTILQHSNHSQHELNEHPSTIQTHNVFNQANIIQQLLLMHQSKKSTSYKYKPCPNVTIHTHFIDFRAILCMFNKYNLKYIHFTSFYNSSFCFQKRHLQIHSLYLNYHFVESTVVD